MTLPHICGKQGGEGCGPRAVPLSGNAAATNDNQRRMTVSSSPLVLQPRETAERLTTMHGRLPESRDEFIAAIQDVVRALRAAPRPDVAYDKIVGQLAGDARTDIIREIFVRVGVNNRFRD